MAWIQILSCSFLIRSTFPYTAQVVHLGLAQSYSLYSDPSSCCCTATADMWLRTTSTIRKWVKRELQGIYTLGYTFSPSFQSFVMSVCAEATKFWCPHPHHISVKNNIYSQRRATVRKLNFLRWGPQYRFSYNHALYLIAVGSMPRKTYKKR